MKKAVLTVWSMIFLAGLVFSQAYEGTIEFKKKKNSAFVIEYPFPPEAVENAIAKKMDKLGNKGKEEKGLFNGDKGFITYSHVFLTDASDAAYDYVIKVERKSKKEENKSLVYMIMLKDDVNQLSLLDADANAKAKSFLNNFDDDIVAAHLELKIRDQEETVTKAEKKYKKLKEDQADMESKIKKLNDSLAENAKSQETASKNLEGEKVALDSLRSSRKQ